MTVALGLVCSDGVVVASDSMATDGATARPVCKVYAENDLQLVWTASGSVYVIEEVEAAIAKTAKEKAVQAICRAPDLAGIRSRLGDPITAAMQKCYGSALPFGLNQLVNQAHHPFFSDFLLLGWSRSTPWFLEIAQDGQRNWHTTSGFATVGSGGAFASVAQGLMAHYLEGERVPVEDGLLVAYRAIATTCAVSSSHVGLPVWLAVATEGEARVLDRAEVDEVGAGVTGWKHLERDTLRTLRAKPETPEELPRFEEETVGAEDPIDEAGGG